MKINSEKDVIKGIGEGKISPEEFEATAPHQAMADDKMCREFRAMAMSLHELMQACLATDKTNSDIVRRQNEIIAAILKLMSREPEKKPDMVFNVIRGRDGKISSIKLSVI